MDRRRQILEVARRLFAQQGFRGTTTRQIADLAGVYESMIFRYLRNKAKLYWTVLDEMIRGKNSWDELLAIVVEHKQAGTWDFVHDEDFLTAIGEGMLRLSRNVPAFTRLFLFSALERHSLSRRVSQSYTGKYCELVEECVHRRIRSGDFRKVDPRLAARSFVGMISHYGWMESLFARGVYSQSDDRTVSRTFARIWLLGVQSNRD
jgi:AcrR family transcriptional regulator